MRRRRFNRQSTILPVRTSPTVFDCLDQARLAACFTQPKDSPHVGTARGLDLLRRQSGVIDTYAGTHRG
jgi:hypothetical protein